MREANERKKKVKTVNIHVKRICSLIHWPRASSPFHPVPTHHTPSLPHLLFPRLVGHPTSHGQGRTQQRRRLVLLLPSRTDSKTTYTSDAGIARLIDTQTVDRPGSLCKNRRVVLHITVAGVGEGGAVGASIPLISGPNAAEVCVEDLGGGGLVPKLVMARYVPGEIGNSWEDNCRKQRGPTICISAKWSGMLQSPSYCATGSFQFDGSGFPASRSEGVVPRGKNQILISRWVHCVAMTPPPFELKSVP